MSVSQSAPGPSPALAYRRLLGMSWAHFLNDGAANYLPGVLPVVLVDLNLSVGLAGTIMAALLVGQGLQPFAGLIADRLGGRALMAVGLLGSSLGAAAIGFSDSVGALAAVLVLIGVSNALFHPQALAGVRQLAANRSGSALSVFLVGGEVGRGVGPAVASWIVVGLGRESLWLLAIPGILTAALLLRWAPALAARRRNAAPIAWRRHWRPLALLVTFCALRATMIFTVITFVPMLWVRAGGSLTVGASLITVLLVVGVVGNLAGGRIGDRIGTRPVLVVGMGAATALLVVFLNIQGPWLWLVCGALGIALFATLPLTVLIAQDILPENRSFGSGLALGLANAMGALGLIALGPVAQTWMPAATLWAAAGCGVIATALALTIPNHGGAKPATV